MTTATYHPIVVSALGLFFTCSPLAAPADDKPIDYGADKVNSMQARKDLVMSGQDNYDYLGLLNHHGPSGVPVGGIGVGCFDYAPDGAFTRVAINNWQSDGGGNYCVESVPGSFVAVWRDGQAKVLRRGAQAGEGTYAGMTLAQKTVYKGLFPIAECQFDDTDTVRVWSGLTPQDVKDSSLPMAWIEVEVNNPDSAPKPIAVAFSWQDVIGRQIRDIVNPDLVASMADKPVWARQRLCDDATKAGKKTWGMIPRVATSAKAYAAGGFTGILQNSAPLESNLKTFQNYNNEIAVMAENAPGVEISTLPSFDVNSPDSAWESFRNEGRFPSASTNSSDGGSPLFDPRENKEKASAVVIRATLMPGEKRTMRFLVAWFQPEIDLSHALPGSYFGKADYGRYYMNSFPDIDAMVTYAGSNETASSGRPAPGKSRSWIAPIRIG